MMAALAALGWTLAVLFFVSAYQNTRAARGWRMKAERLLKQYDPQSFALYAAEARRLGIAPLIDKEQPDASDSDRK